jgi:serine/threonine-protein kinase RsbW
MLLLAGKDHFFDERFVIFPAKIGGLRRMLEFIREAAMEAGCGSDEMKQIELASEEALVNIIHYAYEQQADGNVEIICLSPAKGTITVVFRDHGIAFNPLESVGEVDPSLPLEKRPIGGLGVYLIRQLMDRVEYKREKGANELRLTKGKRAPHAK